MATEPVLLVTGTFGTLASRVLRRLAEERPGRIITVGRLANRRLAVPSGVEFVDGDLRDGTLWAHLPNTITHVFHLAAAIPWQRERKTDAAVILDNLTPLSHLLERSYAWTRLRQIIFASSVAVYGWSAEILYENAPKQPADLYGAAKLAAEDLLLAAAARGIAVASLRYSSLVGHGQYPGTVIPAMVRAARQEQRICVFGAGSRSQDFLHYDDAAEAALLAYRCAAAGAFNIAAGKSITMTQLAELIREVCSSGTAAIEHRRDLPEGDPGFRVDISKAVRELGYRPRFDLRFGLAELSRVRDRE
jgi:UDP-glucose 4-epimerase